MTRLEYAEVWNFKFQRMADPISFDDARHRYSSASDQDWFSVGAFGVGSPEGGVPEYTLEIVPGPSFIGVSFYDQAYRQCFKYGFRRTDDRMFLQTVWSWEYPDDGAFHKLNGSLVTASRTFRPDGTMHWRSSDKRTQMVEEFDAADIDVEKHWEDIPVFGAWDSISRFER